MSGFICYCGCCHWLKRKYRNTWKDLIENFEKVINEIDSISHDVGSQRSRRRSVRNAVKIGQIVLTTVSTAYITLGFIGYYGHEYQSPWTIMPIWPFDLLQTGIPFWLYAPYLISFHVLLMLVAKCFILKTSVRILLQESCDALIWFLLTLHRSLCTASACTNEMFAPIPWRACF